MSNLQDVGTAFWTACAHGRLILPRCSKCRHLRWYLQPRCPRCQEPGYEWAELSGRATLFSCTVVHRSFSAVGPAVPYAVALVLPVEDPGVRLVTRLIDYELSDLRDARELELVFVAEGGRNLPLFRPTALPAAI